MGKKRNQKCVYQYWKKVPLTGSEFCSSAWRVAGECPEHPRQKAMGRSAVSVLNGVGHNQRDDKALALGSRVRVSVTAMMTRADAQRSTAETTESARRGRCGSRPSAGDDEATPAGRDVIRRNARACQSKNGGHRFSCRSAAQAAVSWWRSRRHIRGWR